MIQKNQGGGILKSGSAKKYPFQKFWGGGGNVNLENSRFNWVFLNVGLPYLNWHKNNGTRRRYSQLCRHFEIYKSIKENTWITLLQLIWSLLNVYPFIKFSYFLLILIYNIDNGAAGATAAAPAGLVDVEARRSVSVPAELAPAIYVVKEFVCNICGKTYKKAFKLKEHNCLTRHLFVLIVERCLKVTQPEWLMAQWRNATNMTKCTHPRKHLWENHSNEHSLF